MLKKTFNEWVYRTNDRQKLQTIYAIVTIFVLLIAGVVALVNQKLGLQIVNIAYLAAIVWLVNFVTWAMYLALTTKQPDEIEQTKARKTRRK